jgi:hypothetical protein
LSSKSRALDELVVWEREAQIRLQTLGDEKKTQEQLLDSTHKMLSKRDYYSSAVISSVVAHVVALLKSHTFDLDVEQLQRDFTEYLDNVFTEYMDNGYGMDIGI